MQYYHTALRSLSDHALRRTLYALKLVIVGRLSRSLSWLLQYTKDRVWGLSND